MKYRYYITETHSATITGTNNPELAIYYAVLGSTIEDGMYVVLDTQTGKKVSGEHVFDIDIAEMEDTRTDWTYTTLHNDI